MKNSIERTIKSKRDANPKQKALILQKAGELFWDRGYDHTSIRDIARAAGFEPSNIYYYFRNKEQILYDLVWQEIDQLIQSIKHLEENESGSPSERLRSVIQIHLDLTLKNQKSSLRLLPDAELKRLLPRHRVNVIRARDTYDRIIRQIIRSGMDKGDFTKGDEKLFGFAVASMIVRSRIWYSPKGKYSVAEIADFIFDIAMKGLGASVPD